MHARNLLILAYFGFGTCALFPSKIPDAVWQKGTLTDIRDEQWTSVSGIRYGEYASVSGGTYTVHHFTIDTPDMIFEVTPVKFRTIVMIDKGKIVFVVNSQVEYAIEKANMYLRGLSGQVEESQIEKRTLKQQK